MDDQTMERLLIDRAVGQLDGDAAALLAEYLDEHVELQESVESIEQTVQLAERAFQGNVAIDLPPLDRRRIESSRRRSRRSKLLGQVLAVAASFVLGATTALMMPAERSIVDGRETVATESAALVAYPTAQPVNGENFWSLKRMAVTGQVRNSVRREYPSGAIRQAFEAAF